jgi:hypothetical protein
MSADLANPCYVDIFPYYVSAACEADCEAAYTESRRALREDLEAFCARNPALGDTTLVDASNPLQPGIEKVFDDGVEDLVSRLTAGGADMSETCLCRGVENVDMLGKESPARAYPMDVVFPLGRMEFEGVEYAVPGDVEAVLDAEYGNYLSLPFDILSGYRHIS